MHRSPALVLAALLLPASLAACSDDGPDRLAAGDDLSVEAALAELHLPELDEQTPIAITVLDLEAASEANGASRPGADADDGDVQQWWADVSRPAGDGDDAPPIPLRPVDAIGLGLAPAEAIRDELGFSVAAIDSAAQVQAPPYVFAVVQGDVGEEDLAGADLEEQDGTFSAGSGDDLEASADGRTDVRRTGAPLRLAAEGDRVAVSSTTDELTAWRDGAGRSLAEQEDLRGVAAALDGGDVVTAVILTGDFGKPAGAGEGAPGNEDARPEVIPIGEAFTAAGVGFAADGDETLITVAYAFADDDAADTAVAQVESAYADAVSLRTLDPISDLLELDQVEADGSVVVARLRVVEGPPDAITQMLTGHDTPFTHR